MDKSAMHKLRAKLRGGRKQLTRLQKKNKGGGDGGKRMAGDKMGDARGKRGDGQEKNMVRDARGNTFGIYQ